VVDCRVAFVLNRTKISSRPIIVTICSRQRHSKTPLSIYFLPFLPLLRSKNSPVSRRLNVSFVFHVSAIINYFSASRDSFLLACSCASRFTLRDLCEQALQQRSWLIIKDHRPTDEDTRPFIWFSFFLSFFSTLFPIRENDCS